MILAAAAGGSTIGLVAYYIRCHARIDIAVMLVLLAAACGGPSLLARPHLIALPLVALWDHLPGLGARPRHRTAMVPTAGDDALGKPARRISGRYRAGGCTGRRGDVRPQLQTPGCSPRLGAASSLGAIIAAMLTPHGVDGLLFPFRLMSMKNLYQIQEWKPSDFSRLNGFGLSILLALYLGLSGTLRLPKFRVLLITALILAAMQHVRYDQLFGVMAPLLIVNALGGSEDLRLPWATRLPAWMPIGLLGVIALVSLSLRIGQPEHRIDMSTYPSAALAGVPPDLRTRPRAERIRLRWDIDLQRHPSIHRRPGRPCTATISWTPTNRLSMRRPACSMTCYAATTSSGRCSDPVRQSRR